VDGDGVIVEFEAKKEKKRKVRILSFLSFLCLSLSSTVASIGDTTVEESERHRKQATGHWHPKYTYSKYVHPIDGYRHAISSYGTPSLA
jgi:hypothetical protein